MCNLNRLLTLVLCIHASSSLSAQSLEALQNKIVQTYRDSLAKYIPQTYDGDLYFLTEGTWDRKIFSLNNKDVVEYLKLNGHLDLYLPEISKELFLPLARKALKGNEFHFSLYSKNLRSTQVKPSLAKFGDAVCACWEPKAAHIPNNALFTSNQAETFAILQACQQEQMIKFRAEITQDYNLLYPASQKIFSNLLTGYLFSNCPRFVEERAEDKALSWALNLASEMSRTYAKCSWNVINAARKQISDTLVNQFVDIASFQKTKPILLNLNQFFTKNPNAESFTQPKAIEQKAGKTFQVFSYVVDKKVLFQTQVEYGTDPYGKIKSIVWIPREKIKNLAELEKSMPPPFPKDVPPPPTQEIIKH